MNALSRRRCLGRLVAVPWALSGGISWLPMAQAEMAESYRARRLLMGTWVDITVAQRGSAQVLDAVESAFNRMGALAAVMSRFDPSSAVSEVNRSAGRRAVTVPADLIEMLVSAQALHHQTAGAFDVTLGRLTRPEGADGVPGATLVRDVLRRAGPQRLRLDRARSTAYLDDALFEIDLGGVAKLPILASGLRVLAQRGVHGAMINGGGDVLASARSDGQPWRIGVRDAASPEHLLAVMPLREGVVASSGDYERFVLHEGQRYHHIVDPKTGRPSRGVHGVTLVADSAASINGLGAAAMVAGMGQGADLLQRCGATQAVMVADDGRIWVSPALTGRLQAVKGREMRLSAG